MANKIERPGKTEYYLSIAKQVAQRCNCLMINFGAIIVKDDQIVATGYVGSPRKTRDCMEYGGCLRRKLGIPSGQRYEMCRSVHAEQNALINAARSGANVKGGTLYLYCEKKYQVDEPILVDALPCFICKKMIINSGLDKFVGNTKDGGVHSFNVKDWAAEWRERDMSEDMIKYNADYKKDPDSHD